MEFPIYYVILDTMLLLHSAFGVFLIALWHACILMLAYCWGARECGLMMTKEVTMGKALYWLMVLGLYIGSWHIYWENIFSK